MIIALHNLATAHANLLTGIRIAIETGYTGVELSGQKLRRYLDQGFGIEGLRPLFKQVPPVSMSYVQDIERQGPREYEALLEECESVCSLAAAIDCPMVQLLTGPLDPNGAYKGLTGRPWDEIRQLTAKNLVALSAIGRAHGIRFFLEALTFTPLNRLDQQIQLLDEAGCDNVGLVLDFYHLWDSGTEPDAIAKLDKGLIYCVDFCDSLDEFGTRGDSRQRGRDVWTGGGRIPLKQWVDAVKATGFDGVWKCELLSPRYWELDPRKTAADLKTFLEYLLV